MTSKEPTPAQVRATQARHPGMLLLFRVSDTDRAYGEHALIIGNLLGDAAQVQPAIGEIPACVSIGAPHLERFPSSRLRAGQRVVICDSVGE
jgi:MutS-like protein